jgi:long-chain acyl-CoA synthetase
VVLRRKFDAAEVLQTFGQEKISLTFFAPTMIRMLLDVPGVEKYDVSSLKTITFGGAPMSYELLTEAVRVLQCDFLQGFGQTEASPAVTLMDQEEYRAIAKDPALKHRLISVGKDFPGVHVRIVDDQDRDVPRGEAGEVVLRGDNVMIGYYKMPEATEETLRGGWLHTGDIGKYDEEGYLYLVDRKKDMIISGGENIYCPEIENVIMKIKGVVEAAVVGVPHEKWGEVPKAFVVRIAGGEVTADEILASCKENLAGYKCPKEIAFVDELPRNAAGKILKRKLKENA